MIWAINQYIVLLTYNIPLDDVKGDNVLLAEHKSIFIKKNYYKNIYGNCFSKKL